MSLGRGLRPCFGYGLAGPGRACFLSSAAVSFVPLRFEVFRAPRLSAVEREGLRAARAAHKGGPRPAPNAGNRKKLPMGHRCPDTSPLLVGAWEHVVFLFGSCARSGDPAVSVVCGSCAAGAESLPGSESGNGWSGTVRSVEDLGSRLTVDVFTGFVVLGFLLVFVVCCGLCNCVFVVGEALFLLFFFWLMCVAGPPPPVETTSEQTQAPRGAPAPGFFRHVFFRGLVSRPWACFIFSL